MFDTMRAQAATAMPQAAIVADDFQLARDIVRFVTEGSAQPGTLTFDAERRLAALKQFLATLVASEAGGTFLRAVAAAQAATPDPDAPGDAA
jgi:hypothetical protein